MSSNDNPYISPGTGAEPTNNHIGKRPLWITVVCGFMFVATLCLVPFVPQMMNRFATTYGWWYGPIWLLSLVATLTSLVGYWRMRRWGVYLYAISVVVFTTIGWMHGVPLTGMNLVGPGAILMLGLVYWERMR